MEGSCGQLVRAHTQNHYDVRTSRILGECLTGFPLVPLKIINFKIGVECIPFFLEGWIGAEVL